MYEYGAIVFVLVIVLIFMAQKKMLDNEKYIMCLAFFIVTIASFAEHHLLEIAYNPFIFSVFACMSNNDKVIMEEKRICLNMISVCVAAFNGEKYIEEQILSVLRNLDSQDEIIISDDGSSDRTRRIVDDLAEKDRRIRIIDGPRKGLIKNFENAIVHSKGDIIFLCDQDDVWKDNKVKQY